MGRKNRKLFGEIGSLLKVKVVTLRFILLIKSITLIQHFAQMGNIILEESSF